MKMCRNSVQERSRMKKKIVIFLLAVFLVFALLVSALCFFAPKKNQNSRENTTEQPKTEDTAEQTEKEKREQYHFTNLEYIYYINSENETDFEEQAAEYVEKNYKNVQWINALAKFDDDVSSNTGTATFYLQLDDEDNSVVLISYDKKKKFFHLFHIKSRLKILKTMEECHRKKIQCRMMKKSITRLVQSRSIFVSHRLLTRIIH